LNLADHSTPILYLEEGGFSPHVEAGGEGGGAFPPPRGHERVPGLDSQVYCTWRKEDFLLTLRQEGREGVRFLHHVASGENLERQLGVDSKSSRKKMIYDVFFLFPTGSPVQSQQFR